MELISATLPTSQGTSSWLGTACGALEATFLVSLDGVLVLGSMDVGTGYAGVRTFIGAFRGTV